MQRKIVYPLLAILFIVMIWQFFSRTSAMISDIKQAEYALSATDVITLAVKAYVEERGQWPSSWKDVESVSVKHGKYLWPDDMDDIKDIQSCVEIDFSATLEQVASQRGKDFSAIQAKESANGGSYRYIRQLLDAVDKVRSQAEKEKNEEKQAM